MTTCQHLSQWYSLCLL